MALQATGVTVCNCPQNIPDPACLQVVSWNSLPEDMRDPECSVDSYRQSLKTFLFSQYWCVQPIRGYYENALYKYTVLLTFRLTLTLDWSQSVVFLVVDDLRTYICVRMYVAVV